MKNNSKIKQKNFLLRQYTFFSILWFLIFSVVAVVFIKSELEDHITGEIQNILTHIAIFIVSGLTVVYLILFIIIFKASRDLIKLQNLEIVKNDLLRYFSPQVAENIISHGSGSEFGTPVHADVTILFMDIRGFTSQAEQDDPELIFTLLNQFYGEMIEVIFQNYGVLDKIIGDSLMGLFGVPVPSDDKCNMAVKTAISMQNIAKDFNAIMKNKVNKKFPIGIGVNRGICMAGNLGSEGRKIEYTVIGDPVNTAARLQGIAGPGEIIISEDVKKDLSGGFNLVQLDDVMLKGKEKPTQIYRVDY